MKKQTILAAMVMTSLAAAAQETYESAQLATEDLNGTARYVGMGGAMEALGADISTMGSNPAGIGLFRRSWAGVSAGVTFQQQGHSNMGVNIINDKNSVTNADLNQAGFVYSTQCGSQSWFNIGVNFHKSRNFNMVAGAVNSLYDGSSLNKMSAMRLASLQPDSKYWQNNWPNTQVRDKYDSRWDELSRLDQMNYNVINEDLIGFDRDADGNITAQQEGYSGANQYWAYNKNSGYIGEYDINFSGNLNDRVYLGVTLGLKDVHYKNENFYMENLVDANDNDRGRYAMADNRAVTGTGFDIKFGIIFRPMEDSPFRIGAYIHTPTWYDLTCATDLSVGADFTYNESSYNNRVQNQYGIEYKYKITTPWKFGLSLGHTFNNVVALGATYEYADYSFIRNKIVFDQDHSVFEKDYDMDRNTEATLRGVSTAKIGVEVKPVPEVSLRLGYNYVSPMYKDYSSKDFTISPAPEYGSNGSYYSTYDYINWKDTHRVTFGLGFVLSKNLNLDMAYQFSTQKGDYHPFQSVYGLETYTIAPDASVASVTTDSNIGTPTSIKNNRHQVNVTLGYRF